jgi:hypothetical protein
LKNGHGKEGGQIIELFLAILTWPNLTCWEHTTHSVFHHLTPLVGGQCEFLKERFSKEQPILATYPNENTLEKKRKMTISTKKNLGLKIFIHPKINFQQQDPAHIGLRASIF